MGELWAKTKEVAGDAAKAVSEGTKGCAQRDGRRSWKGSQRDGRRRGQGG